MDNVIRFKWRFTMLMNSSKAFPPSVCALIESDIPVYLTGSRYFGGENQNSDWDFFTEFSADTIAKLLMRGYRSVPKTTNYSDRALFALYELDPLL